MKSERSIRRAVSISAGATLVALLAMVAPASADPTIQTIDQASGNGNGTFTLPFTAPGTPLSNQFRYTFTNSDHHIKTVTDLPGSGTIQVSFSDINGDDNYNYNIAHDKVPATGIVTGTFSGSCGGGSCTSAIARPPGDVVFVLTGFRFNFSSGDHHLDNIGVVESGGNLTTWFNDNNNDDDYTTTITYAWVPRSRLSTIAQVSNDKVHAVGGFRSPAAEGRKVLRGFFLDNIGTGGSGDNHIRDLGVVPGSTFIDVFYADDNPGDSADWKFQVPYAVVLN